MIKFENVIIPSPEQWRSVIMGARNPLNSWDRYDSEIEYESPHDMSGGKFTIGQNDYSLLTRLAKAGPTHAKYRRMIVVYVDITAPLYWWKEFDTHKVGTVANSCSTMHKIAAKEFTWNDFSTEHLLRMYESKLGCIVPPVMEEVIKVLNECRVQFLQTQDKRYWWQMILLLPSSYNQKRTVMLNYEVLAGIYSTRKNHKLDEWREFCKWIERLPYSELITCNSVPD